MAAAAACISWPVALPLPSAFRAYRTPSLSPLQSTRRPIFASCSYPKIILPRLKISQQFPAALKCGCAVSNLGDSGSDIQAEKEATIDLRIPRRRMLVQFTCNVCGATTQRVINPLAYKRGTVFVQCAGCLRHHKLVDNLDLVVEYDLREDASVETNSDQI